MVVAVLAAAGVLASPAAGHPERGLNAFPGQPFVTGWLQGLLWPLDEPGSSAGKTVNVRVVGHVDPGGGFNGDVVAHRGYAYLGSWGSRASAETCPSQGVRVYSLFNMASPQLAATFAGGTEPGLAGTWTEKVIVRSVSTPSFKGDLATVSVQACVVGAFRGFALYDVTNPAQPKRLALVETPGTSGSHEIWLQPVGSKVYVYTAIPRSEQVTSPDGATPGQADFRIFDVSDPSAPVQVGAWGAWKELGIPTGGWDANGVPRVNFVHSVTGDGTRAYLSYWDLGAVILDVSNPAAPKYLGRTTFAPNEEGNAHSTWVDGRTNVLVQTDEDFSVTSDSTGTLEQAWGYAHFYDVSNPASPQLLSTFKLPSTTQSPQSAAGYYSVHDPKLSGRYAYLSWYAEGVVVLDVSRPTAPRLVAQFVPPPAPDARGFWGPPDAAFTHVWGTFVYGANILASDINSGLWIFQVR
jgi:hypothetical protein